MHSVDNLLRVLTEPPVTTVTSGGWSLLYSPLPRISKLYNLAADPKQSDNVIEPHMDVASDCTGSWSALCARQTCRNAS